MQVHLTAQRINTMSLKDLMFVDPCIIVQFIKKIQQDATMYQKFYYSIFI